MKIHLASRCILLLAPIGLLTFFPNSSAMACAACYGDTSGSKMANAATIGIFAMVVIMFAMLGAVAAFGWYLSYRAKHPLPDYQELLSEDDGLPKPEPSAS
jgi:hypothetical protein